MVRFTVRLCHLVTLRVGTSIRYLMRSRAAGVEIVNRCHLTMCDLRSEKCQRLLGAPITWADRIRSTPILNLGSRAIDSTTRMSER